MEGSALDLIQIGSAIYQNYLGLKTTTALRTTHSSGTKGQSHSSLAAVMDTTSCGYPRPRDIRRNKWLRERSSHEETDGIDTNTTYIAEDDLNNERTSSATLAAGNDTPRNNDIYQPLIEKHESSIEETDLKKRILDLYCLHRQKIFDILAGYRSTLTVLVGLLGFFYAPTLACRIVLCCVSLLEWVCCYDSGGY